MPAAKTKSKSPTTLRPLLLPTDKLALAAWIVRYVTPAGKPFLVCDAPERPDDRCLRLLAMADRISVQVGVPLASKPGPHERRNLVGGLFDSDALKALDGLEWSQEPINVSHDTAGARLVIDGPALRHPVYVQAMTPRGRLPAAVIPGYPDRPDSIEEFAFEEVRTRLVKLVTKGDESGEKLPSHVLVLLAVLERIAPSSVEITTHPDVVGLTGQTDGFTFGIGVPRL